MEYIVDRFEAEFAICETEKKETVLIQKNQLPPSVQEGDVLIFRDGTYTIDVDATARYRDSIRREMMELFD